MELSLFSVHLNTLKTVKLEYLFGASGQSAIGTKKLRCRVGPSLDTLTIAKVNDEESPHFIDSPFFTGNVCVRIKNFRGVTPDGSEPIETLPYFENKKRLFSIQVSGRFKHEYTADDVVFGASFQKKVAPPTGAWMAIKFANLIDPALKSDIYAEKPWLWSPSLCSYNIVNVTKAQQPVFNAHPTESRNGSEDGDDGVKIAGPDISKPKDSSKEISKPRNAVDVTPSPDDLLTKWIWKGEEELQEATDLLFPDDEDRPFPPAAIAERRKYFQKEDARKSFVFKPDYVYTIEMFAPFIDLNTFDLTLGININLLQYLNHQPIRLMSKSMSKDIPFFIVEFDLVDEESEESGTE